jgi:hypothetical protein
MAIKFEIGDRVVYNPTMINLPPMQDRPWDHGVIIAMDAHYATVRFDSGFETRVLFWGIKPIILK